MVLERAIPDQDFLVLERRHPVTDGLLASRGAALLIASRIFFSMARAGSATPARYSSTVFPERLFPSFHAPNRPVPSSSCASRFRPSNRGANFRPLPEQSCTTPPCAASPRGNPPAARSRAASSRSRYRPASRGYRRRGSRVRRLSLVAGQFPAGWQRSGSGSSCEPVARFIIRPETFSAGAAAASRLPWTTFSI